MRFFGLSLAVTQVSSIGEQERCLNYRILEVEGWIRPNLLDTATKQGNNSDPLTLKTHAVAFSD